MDLSFINTMTLTCDDENVSTILGLEKENERISWSMQKMNFTFDDQTADTKEKWSQEIQATVSSVWTNRFARVDY